MTFTANAMDKTKTQTSRRCSPLWRLLWKEFSERRWWAICWALGIVAVSFLARGQQFFGVMGETMPPGNYLSLIFAGVVGLGGYTSELRRGRALFLFTRPTHWHAVLWAKVLFGVITILAAAVLAAGLFRLTCPEPYHHFVTLPNMLMGIGVLAWPIVLCYLGGLAASVILPGLAGGALTVVSIGVVIVLMLAGDALVWSLLWLHVINDNTPKIDLIMLCARGHPVIRHRRHPLGRRVGGARWSLPRLPPPYPALCAEISVRHAGRMAGRDVSTVRHRGATFSALVR